MEFLLLESFATTSRKVDNLLTLFVQVEFLNEKSGPQVADAEALTDSQAGSRKSNVEQWFSWAKATQSFFFTFYVFVHFI